MKWLRINRKNQQEDFISPREELKETSKTSVRDLIDGSLLTHKNVVKQLPFLVYLTLLGIIYISNHYRYEEEYRELSNMKKEVSEARFQSIYTASELMKISKRSEVVKRVNNEEIGLVELKKPASKIMVKKR